MVRQESTLSIWKRSSALSPPLSLPPFPPLTDPFSDVSLEASTVNEEWGWEWGSASDSAPTGVVDGDPLPMPYGQLGACVCVRYTTPACATTSSSIHTHLHINK